MTEPQEKDRTTGLTVDDDELYEDVELPEVFLRTDRAAAESGGKRLSALLRMADQLYGELELIERALRISEPQSARSRAVRVSVRSALAGLEHAVVGGIDTAHITLIRDWDEHHVR